MRVLVILIIVMIVGCKSDDEGIRNYITINVNDTLSFETDHWTFSEDEFMYMGDWGTSIRIELWKEELGGNLGISSKNEVKYYSNSSSYEEAEVGEITKFELDGDRISGMLKTTLFKFEGGKYGEAEIVFENCEINQAQNTEGYMCGNVNETEECFKRTNYLRDEFENHTWVLYNTKTDYINLRMAPGQLKEGTYEMQEEYTPNQKQEGTTIWYKKKNQELPIRIKEGELKIESVSLSQIEGTIDAVLETTGKDTKIENLEFVLKM